MGSTYRPHHRLMQSPAEPRARNSWIDLGRVQKHVADRQQGTDEVRHRLQMHGLRQCGSNDEGKAGSASGTGSEDLLWIVTWNTDSVDTSKQVSKKALYFINDNHIDVQY